jgi:amino acid transporter
MATMDSVTLTPLPKLSRWPGTIMKIAMICSIIALILLVAAGPGYRMGVVPLIAALLATALGFFLFIVAFIGGAIAWVTARRTARPIPRGATTLVILAGVVAVFGVAFILRARGAPPIHEITTDFTDPPAFKDVLALRIATGAQNPPD